MIKSFFWSKKWFWWAYGGCLVILISLYAQVQMMVRFNTWINNFFNLLQEVVSNSSSHNPAEIQVYLIRFVWIALPYVLLATMTSYFMRIYSLRWREAMTFTYIPLWRNVTQDVENANQRIQDDTFRFARIVESLGTQIAEAIMTLVAFIPILWGLSRYVAVPFIHGQVYQFTENGKTLINNNFYPGSLVWIALIVSIGGMSISWFVGAKLPGLEYNNQRVEATFRAELVLGEKVDKINHATEEILINLFKEVKHNFYRLFLHYGYFDAWRISFTQFMVIVPYMIMGPGLFTGLITLGLLQQVSNSFDQVRGSFSLFINNWTTITELRSIWMRLHEFEDNLNKYQIKNEIILQN